VRNHLKNIEKLKNELLDTVKNNFTPKYIFYNLSDSNMTEEDKKIYYK
jgi:hypothetical protein